MLFLIKEDIAMKWRTQINCTTAEQKAIIRGKYKQDYSLYDTARMLDKYNSSIIPAGHHTDGYRLLAESGIG